jgi:SAM-dependent methyltransferase
VSYPLSTKVARVDAIDLSPAMIERARADTRDDMRIRWIVGDAHSVELEPAYDLIIAGASIHWMDWDRLFPRLAPVLSARAAVAFLEGDGAVNQPWGHDELELMKATQISISAERPAWVDQARFPAPIKESLVVHPWFQRRGGLTMLHGTRKSVDDYIEIFFSRQSFALDTMSEAAANEYRRSLRANLQPYALHDEQTYDVAVTLEWGRLESPV